MSKNFSKNILILLVLTFIMQIFPIAALAEEITNEQTPSGIKYSSLKETVDEYSEKYIGKTTAGASVAILKNDKIIFKQNYGYSDIENKAKITDDTLFEWGSTTKLFVWVSVMQLVEQGKLDLTKDIKEYLPDNYFRKLQFDQPITMLNLMNHNAGWEEHLTDMFYSNPQDVKSLKETLEIIEPKQVHKPGEVVAYSNYGAALAAYIVERIAGISFDEYVNKYILNVLNMKETSINPLQKDNQYVQKNRPLAKGYMENSKGLVERPILYLGIYPAGGAVGTLSDMCKFVSALIPKSGEASPLFKYENTLYTLFSKSYSPTDDFPGVCHGFGEHYYSVRTLEHGGNTDSFSSQITFAPEEGTAVLVMTNQAHERPLCYGLKDLIFGSYKGEQYDGKLPDSSIVTGNYSSLRKPDSGFSTWLNFIVSEVKAVDENTIDIDGDIYREIKPYVYQYTDENGASELIYFNVENDKVKTMYQKCGEYEPLSTLSIISRLVLIGLSFLSSAYFMIGFVISVIFGFKRENNLSTRNKTMISLNMIGFISIVNTGILFYRSMLYPSYAALKIHFIINILSVVLILIFLSINLITRIRRKAEGKRKIGYILTNIFSVLYVMLVIALQIYK